MIIDNEQWKAVKGFEGLYEVSDHGRVKSLSKLVKGGHGSEWWREGKMLSLSANVEYLMVGLSKEGIRKSTTVHSLVAEAFLDHVADGHKIVIDHINGENHDNRAENLQLITHLENVEKGYVKKYGNRETKKHLLRICELEKENAELREEIGHLRGDFILGEH